MKWLAVWNVLLTENSKSERTVWYESFMLGSITCAYVHIYAQTCLRSGREASTPPPVCSYLWRREGIGLRKLRSSGGRLPLLVWNTPEFSATRRFSSMSKDRNEKENNRELIDKTQSGFLEDSLKRILVNSIKKTDTWKPETNKQKMWIVHSMEDWAE